MQNLMKRFAREEEGQDLIEYGLLIGIVTLACLTAIKGTSTAISGYFTSLDTLLT